jgi:hypothetical protein
LHPYNAAPLVTVGKTIQRLRDGAHFDPAGQLLRNTVIPAGPDRPDPGLRSEHRKAFVWR